ncbi:MAG: hypothetical protein JWN56_799 [Sphingobacteriales bacterium]|nr:hypothetical protein [Sphingobacteriales bacterium]
MSIEQYILDEQDPKTAEKVLGKLNDMLTTGETILYLAIQKKPAVTLIPDCISVTNKRIVFCIPGNLGLTTNFITFTWGDVKEVSFKEEFFGSKFITVPQRGENMTIDYIPKIQARKLYQFCNEQIEKLKETLRNQEIEDRTFSVQTPTPAALAEIIDKQPELREAATEEIKHIEQPVDELTQKLQKLKLLFEKQLITQDEYETKKADILSQL